MLLALESRDEESGREQVNAKGSLQDVLNLPRPARQLKQRKS